MESTAQLIGLVSGGIAVSIAIYFQMISQRLCPVKYILAFFAVGAALMLINAGALGVSPLVSVTLETIVYLIILVSEIVAAYKLNKKLENGNFNFSEIGLLNLRI